MKINKRRVLIGIVIILLIWGANLAYYQTQQLSEPIVLQSYYELNMRERDAFDIYYLVNKTDNLQLVEVRTPEGRSLRVNHDFTEDTFTHHFLRRASIELHKDNIDDLMKDGNYSFTQLELLFNNGEKVNTEIGEIIIHQLKDQELVDNPLDFKSGGGSSDNTGFTLYSTEEPVIIESFRYQWQEELKDFLYIYINTSQEALDEIVELQTIDEKPRNLDKQEELEEYVDNREKLQQGLYSMEGEKISNALFPLKLDAGDHIKINHKLDFGKKNKLSRNCYFISLRLAGETLDNKEFKVNTYVNYRPYFTNSEIRQIIREKRRK